MYSFVDQSNCTFMVHVVGAVYVCMFCQEIYILCCITTHCITFLCKRYTHESKTITEVQYNNSSLFMSRVWPVINLIYKGKQAGRKRGLFILKS